MVAWALLRFQVGGGTFVRTKLVLIHFNGANTPALQRGLLNARANEVVEKLGEVHSTMEVTSCKELSVESLCERLLRLFTADNMDYSLQVLRQDYSRMVAETEHAARQREQEAAVLKAAAVSAAKAKAEEEAAKAASQLQQLERPALNSRHCADISLEEALQGVSCDRGDYNWLWLDPARLTLHKAGQGGFDEMKDHLAEERVLFGVLRLTFGSGVSEVGRSAKGITKHVFIHWVGPRVSVVRRGVWNARSGEVGAIISKWCAVNFRKEAHSEADLQLDDIIMGLRRLTVVDGVAVTDGVAASRISVEEYRFAMAEEARERAAEQERRQQSAEEPKQEKETGKWGLQLLEDVKEEVREDQAAVDDKEKPALPDMMSAVEAVREPAGTWNWVLCGWQQLPAAFMPPSPCRGR